MITTEGLLFQFHKVQLKGMSTYVSGYIVFVSIP